MNHLDPKVGLTSDSQIAKYWPIYLDIGLAGLGTAIGYFAFGKRWLPAAIGGVAGFGIGMFSDVFTKRAV